MNIIRLHYNKKAIALIISYTTIAVLTTLGIGFVSAGLNELTQVERFKESTASFWLAEAGLAESLVQLEADQDWTPSGTALLGDGSYSISLTNGLTGKIVSVTGNCNGIQRKIQVTLPYVNKVFQNTLSCGGNMHLGGWLAQTTVDGKTRLTGTFSKDPGTSATFEDKLENQPVAETTITYPDMDDNGTSDEFNDFKLYNQALLSEYDASEVVYITTDNTVNIYPNRDYVGKKIIYVEGSTPGSGDVNIYFDASWSNGEDLTVISTGTVDYVEPLQFQQDARLSTVSWDEYHEYCVFLSTHDGVNYAHDEAKFYDIFQASSTDGNVIANQGINLTEVVSLKYFKDNDRAANGDVPPGLEGLIGASPVLVIEPTDWQEVEI